jgi:autotransporter-associated beta strand protein
MKNTSLRRAAILSAVLAVGLAPQARATLYWDIDGINAGAGGGASPTGTWDTNSTPNWSTAINGDVAPTVWTAGEDAVFSAGSTATGGFTVTIPTGTTVVANSVTMNTGSLLLGPGTLSFGATAGNFTINTGATFNVSGAGSGFIAGTAGIVKNGSGTLDLGGSEQYSSASGAQLTVTAGTANFSGDTALGLVPGAFRTGAVTLDGGALNFTGGSSLTTSNLRGFSVTANGGTINIVNNVSLIIGANPGIAGPSNSVVTRTGTGTFTPSSAGAFTGKWVFLGGLQSIAGDSRFGSTAPGSPVADSITLSNAAIRTTTVGGLTINANRGIRLGAGGGTFILNSGVTGGMTYNGIISGTAGGAFTIAGESDSVFANLGGPNTYNGSTIVRRGTLNTTAANVLPNTTTLSIGATSSLGTLNLGGFNQTIAGLLTAGTAANQRITNNGSSDATLTINNDAATTNADFSFGGIIIDGATNKTNIVKSGSRSLALTGANTYTGQTTVTGGSLSISGTSKLGSGAGTLNLSGGRLNTSANRDVTTDPVLNPINVTADTIVSSSSTATTVNLNFSSNNIGGSGGTLTFRYDGANDAGDTFQPRFSGNGFDMPRNIVVNNTTGKTVLGFFNLTGTSQTFSGVISGTGALNRSSGNAGSGNGGTTVLTGTNLYTGTTTIAEGTLSLGTTGSIDNTPSIALTNSTATLDVSSKSSTFTLGAAQSLSGVGKVRGPMIAAGTLSPGNSIGNLHTGSLTLNDGSKYVFEIQNSGNDRDNISEIPAAVPGTDHDTITMDEDANTTLDVAATTGGVTVFVRGTAANFQKTLSYEWILADVGSGGVTNFSADDFVVDASSFTNDLTPLPEFVGTGGFNVAVSGGDLVLRFDAVPEPTSAGLLLMGGAATLLGRRRRKAKAQLN